MVPPSANELRRKYRSYFAYRDRRKLWELALMGAIGSAGELKAIREATKGKRKCVKIKQHRLRLLDEDNAVAAVKPCLDAMVRLKLIAGDSQKHIQLETQQLKADAKPQTVITIEPSTDSGAARYG